MFLRSRSTFHCLWLRYVPSIYFKQLDRCFPITPGMSKLKYSHIWSFCTGFLHGVHATVTLYKTCRRAENLVCSETVLFMIPKVRVMWWNDIFDRQTRLSPERELHMRVGVHRTILCSSENESPVEAVAILQAVECIAMNNLQWHGYSNQRYTCHSLFKGWTSRGSSIKAYITQA